MGVFLAQKTKKTPTLGVFLGGRFFGKPRYISLQRRLWNIWFHIRFRWWKEKLALPATTYQTATFSKPRSVFENITYGTVLELRMQYTFTVNTTDMYGPYRVKGYAFDSRNVDNDTSKIDIFTQMETFYARRMLPCFDEPEYKVQRSLNSFLC